MTVKELAKATNRSESWIYSLAAKLKRLPTIAEVESRKNKRGRPAKWRKESEATRNG